MRTARLDLNPTHGLDSDRLPSDLDPNDMEPLPLWADLNEFPTRELDLLPESQGFDADCVVSEFGDLESYQF
jgi:hypothetical protein